jgi:hypothetical protein
VFYYYVCEDIENKDKFELIYATLTNKIRSQSLTSNFSCRGPQAKAALDDLKKRK